MTLRRWSRRVVPAAFVALSICISAAGANAEAGPAAAPGPALQFAGPSVQVAAVIGPTVIGPNIVYSPVQTSAGSSSANGATIVGSAVVGPGAGSAAASQNQAGPGFGV